MTTDSVLTLNPANKQQIEFFSTDIVGKVKSGELNALEVYTRLKALEKTSENITKQIRDDVMKIVDKYPEKSFNAFGSVVEKSETGVKYSYENCGDPEWQEAADQEKQWAEKRKEREKFLQAVKGSATLVNEETGETYKVYPPSKTSTSFIKVTHK